MPAESHRGFPLGAFPAIRGMMWSAWSIYGFRGETHSVHPNIRNGTNRTPRSCCLATREPDMKRAC
jgi:hypothetical protein